MNKHKVLFFAQSIQQEKQQLVNRKRLLFLLYAVMMMS